MLRAPIIILYVSDQERSRRFYSKILERPPVLDVPGMTEFLVSDGLKLGLMPEKGIAKILHNLPHPETGNGIPRCELYLFAGDPAVLLEAAVNAGATEISKAQKRAWGDTVAYCADPDGHIIAFAK